MFQLSKSKLSYAILETRGHDPAPETTTLTRTYCTVLCKWT